MNYKQLVELAKEEKKNKDSDKFYQCYLETVKKCQTAAEALQAIKRIRPNKTETKMWKEVLKDHVETLRCFGRCMPK